MSKESRARAAAKATTGAQASAASGVARPPEPNISTSRWSSLLAGGIIILAVLAAYWNSFSGPFIFDDYRSIMVNSTIRQLGSSWSPPHDPSGVIGRPMVNFSLAVNYALGGLEVWGYHALNLAIHILAALTLFGIVRRTLHQPVLKKRFGEAATPLAFTVALLWAVHPLQTESVTSVVQRTESLMGLFYLLTLYCFIRSQDSEVRIQEKESGRQSPSPDFWLLTPVSWLIASVFFCLLGMASKEVMVSAPLIVLLYDRTFVAGSFREAWKKRGWWYAGLACTWLLLGYLVADEGGTRGKAAGFGLGVSSWTYALTQCQAIIHYLKLVVWPYPLVFDYGTMLVGKLSDVLPQALMLVLLILATILGLWRRPVFGFVGVWFFAILAPSSSVMPLVQQSVAEHRMYLPLASLMVLAVVGLYALIGRGALYAGVGVAVLLTVLTLRRNEDYRTEASIWTDTVANCPDNARAHNNLGNALIKVPGRLPDAMTQFEAAVRLDPDNVVMRDNLGNILLHVPGRFSDAIAQFEAAVRTNPKYVKAHFDLGNVLITAGRLPDAVAEFQAALKLDPEDPETHNYLGVALSKIPGRLADAITEYQAALRIKPDYAEAHYALGNALVKTQGRWPEGVAEYEAALQIKPDYIQAHYNLGVVLSLIPGREADAMAQLQMALQLNPNLIPARKILNRLQDQSALEGASPTDASFRSNDVRK
jgi:Flp pilus assembly protein TadD